jgi:hypothetical protein
LECSAPAARIVMTLHTYILILHSLLLERREIESDRTLNGIRVIVVVMMTDIRNEQSPNTCYRYNSPLVLGYKKTSHQSEIYNIDS